MLIWIPDRNYLVTEELMVNLVSGAILLLLFCAIRCQFTVPDCVYGARVFDPVLSFSMLLTVRF